MSGVLRGISPARIFARPTAEDTWLGPARQSALSHLVQPTPLKVLHGPSSSGRTTLLKRIRSELAPTGVALHVQGPQRNAVSVLTALLGAAGLAPYELNEIDLRNLLTVFISERRARGCRVLIAVDDVERFEPAALAEVERLALFQLGDRPAVEIAISALEGAAPHALLRGLNALHEAGRRASVSGIGWLTAQDVEAYVEWRLARFELEGLITRTATHLIAQYTEGRFKAIDLLCQMTLLVLKQEGGKRADVRMVERAVSGLSHRSHRSSRVRETRGADPAPLPRGRLYVSRGHEIVERVTLGKRTLVGRSELNDVCLPSPYVSRHHAAILWTPEGFYVADLNSANGVELNGRPVDSARVFDRDVLKLGDFRLKFDVDGDVPTGDVQPDASLDDTALRPRSPGGGPTLRLIK